MKPLRRKVDVDLLHLHVGVETECAQLAPDSGLLVAAPRSFVECRVVCVQPGDAGAQLLQHAQALAAVARKNAASKSIDCVIRQSQCFVLRLEKLDHEHWTENFFAHDLHGRLGFDEDRWSDEIARREIAFGQAISAADQLRALAFSCIYVA